MKKIIFPQLIRSTHRFKFLLLIILILLNSKSYANNIPAENLSNLKLTEKVTAQKGIKITGKILAEDGMPLLE